MIHLHISVDRFLKRIRARRKIHKLTKINSICDRGITKRYKYIPLLVEDKVASNKIVAVAILNMLEV